MADWRTVQKCIAFCDRAADVADHEGVSEHGHCGWRFIVLAQALRELIPPCPPDPVDTVQLSPAMVSALAPHTAQEENQ